MLETNHVRAALLKNLPLFLIITQIIYECNRSTHTCWLGKAYAGTTKRKEDEEEHAALPKPTPNQQANLEGRGKACAMTRK